MTYKSFERKAGKIVTYPHFICHAYVMGKALATGLGRTISEAELDAQATLTKVFIEGSGVEDKSRPQDRKCDAHSRYACSTCNQEGA